MQLKYEKHHNECIFCHVPHLPSAQGGKAYRLVPDAFPTDSEFLPPAIMKPARTFKTAEQRCSAYALSFFTSAHNARRMQAKLAKQIKAFRRMQCIAETAVDPKDGKVSEVDSKGHFDLHESRDARLAHSVTNCYPVGSK
ncbi:hypothetical protein EBB56_18590 [Halomonas sp. YLB-10]|uniref:hypothetical protein n=1 Tax=Halomonas sp. YLB-10 TaxID=2483111 RepID=UPI000F5F77AC|nr:hypothetical protein [Halomonas sp. YLB-10]RQW69057.1 hypothetical protein EBB56_18590 [Halomonas sp. YLB-10]